MKWSRLTPMQRLLLWLVVGLMVAATVLGTIAWFWVRPAPTTDSPESAPPAASPAPTPTAAAPPQAPAESSGFAVIDEDGNVTEVRLQLNADGVATMPVTTDPRLAAAGAAAVAWTMQTERLNRQDFAAHVVQQWTAPSPDYVGPRGEIDAAYSGSWRMNDYTGVKDPAAGIEEAVKVCGFQECLWWWMPMHGTGYDSMRQDGQRSEGIPILVMSDAQMIDWWGEKGDMSFWPDDIDRTPDREGATLTNWFVLTDVFYGFPGMDLDTRPARQPAAFSIWCDAPAEGGLCGVATATQTNKFPEIWPLP